MTSRSGTSDVQATPSDIAKVPVPTPFSVGPVNTYLLQGEPLTLIDAGPATALALCTLEDELRQRGRALSDVELVVLTHGHVDHAGLASVLASRHGAQVACFATLADELEQWEEHAALEDDFAATTMLRHGTPPQVVATIHAASGLIRGLSRAVHVDRRLDDGDALQAGGRQLRVHHRPGHSGSDIVLVDEESRTGFLGDHLILRTSSNANLRRAPAQGSVRVAPLLEMRESLAATAALGVRVGLPGHGDDVFDVTGLANDRIADQDERAEALERLLRQHGPSDAHTLGTQLFGDRATSQAWLVISEVVGHLDLLVERGLVVEHVDTDGSSFEAL